MYSLVFYVPISHLEVVKKAVFAAGAGRMGQYEACCWQVLGQGQFCPKDGAEPYLGSVGRVEQVEEYRVEMVLLEQYKDPVVTALLATHPYEEVAYHLIPVST